MTLPAMAMKITEKNYFIAVACLGSKFATFPTEEIYGCYLVINNVQTDLFFKEETYPEYNNSWLFKKDFNKCYKFTDKELTNQFAEVQEIV
jgi:hypothetical protein